MTDNEPDAVEIDLDLDWVAEEVQPGTPSDEDPNQEIPPGWWVFGYDPDGQREAEFPVRGIYDVYGEDVSREIAELIAETLNRNCGGRG